MGGIHAVTVEIKPSELLHNRIHVTVTVRSQGETHSVADILRSDDFVSRYDTIMAELVARLKRQVTG